MRASEFIVENLGMPYPGTYEQEYQHKSGQRRIGTLTTEEASTNSTTLSKLYNGQYPDRDELFWDYVQKDDLNKELTVHTFSPMKLKILLQSQYRVEDVEEIFDMLDDDRLEIIDHYKKDPNLSQSIIVVANNRIVDGNHRAFASALNNSKINYVDLDDLEEVDEGVFTGMAQRKFIPK